MHPLQLPQDIPAEEQTPLVNWLLNIIAEQRETIDRLEAKVEALENQVSVLEEELKKAKKLPKKPKIKPSNLESKNGDKKDGRKGSGGRKGSKKATMPKSLGKECV
jgi:uncharacterized coiled-coil protein SlyX